MSGTENHRETGARKYPASQDPDTPDDLSPRSTKPRKPRSGKSASKHAARSTPSPATEKVSGAGPALAERSKDAKAPKTGRQPGAYVKDK